jgi:hypothetical protein
VSFFQVPGSYTNSYSETSNTGNATNTAVTGAQKAIASVNVLSEKNSTVLIRMDKTSRLHDERLSSLQQDVREILLFTRSHGHMIHLQLATTQQTSSITSDRSFSSGLEQDSEFNNSLPSIQTRRYQGGGSMIFDAFCSCKTQRTRYSRGRWGPFLLEAEIKSRGHHAPECPMSKLSPVTYQTKRVLNFSLSAIQKFWRSASKVSLSFTSGTGTGTLGSGQTVNWVATVDEESSPLFQIVKTVGRYDHLQRKDMHMLLKSCFRRIIWCYANHHASATDVDENGHSILDWALQRYQVSYCYICSVFNANYIDYRLAGGLRSPPTTWQSYFKCLLLLLSLRPIRMRSHRRLNGFEPC